MTATHLLRVFCIPFASEGLNQPSIHHPVSQTPCHTCYVSHAYDQVPLVHLLLIRGDGLSTQQPVALIPVADLLTRVGHLRPGTKGGTRGSTVSDMTCDASSNTTGGYNASQPAVRWMVLGITPGTIDCTSGSIRSRPQSRAFAGVIMGYQQHVVATLARLFLMYCHGQAAWAEVTPLLAPPTPTPTHRPQTPKP